MSQDNKITLGVRLLGGPSSAADKLKTTRNTVHTWMRQEYVPDEKISDFIIAVHKVAPSFDIDVDDIRKPIVVEAH